MEGVSALLAGLANQEPRAVARAISIVEDGGPETSAILAGLDEEKLAEAVVIGVTGPPGAGKSTLTNRLIQRFRDADRRLGIIAIDPSSPVSGGALLGDRIRMMQHATDRNVVVRSMATRGRLGGLCGAAGAAVRIMAAAGCSPIIIETVGVGQSEIDIIRLADITALVMAPGLGDDIQAMKAGLLEVADLLVVNKADCGGADILAMDLETAARDRSGEPAPVCLTAASTGSGIDQLLATIDNLDRCHRRSGERLRRRQLSYDLEVLDWALELLRPQLLVRIREANPGQRHDPRQRAREILEGFGEDSRGVPYFSE